MSGSQSVLAYMRPISALSVGLMHSQTEVAAAGVWVLQKWERLKAVHCSTLCFKHTFLCDKRVTRESNFLLTL